METDKDYIELKNWLEETRDEPLEDMGAFFDRRIDSYEEHMRPWKSHYKRVAELLPENTENLLDIGCGSGLELDEIFLRLPGINVTGVDLSGEMLSLLNKKHSDKRLTLIKGDYFTTGFGEEKYDAAVSFETLHHFTAKKKSTVFKKLFRALKPGGIYIECDYIAVSQKIQDILFSECNRRRARDKINDGEFIHFDTPLTLENEIEAIKSGGFTSVELTKILPGDNHTAIITAIK